MIGLFATANLLGLDDLRQTRLVDIGNRVDKPIHRVLLTHSLRGVSYPKYELSEASACLIISNNICEQWLSDTSYTSNGSSQPLQEDTSRQRGRTSWNAETPPIWMGLRESVNVKEWTRRIVEGEIADVEVELTRTFAESGSATIYSQVQQNISGIANSLKNEIRGALARTLQDSQNLRYATLFLDGIKAEIGRTRRFWVALGIPSGPSNLQSWRALARSLVQDLMLRRRHSEPRSWQERNALVADELGEIITRLEMFLMSNEMETLERWIDADLGRDSFGLGKQWPKFGTWPSFVQRRLRKNLTTRPGPCSRYRDRLTANSRSKSPVSQSCSLALPATNSSDS